MTAWAESITAAELWTGGSIVGGLIGLALASKPTAVVILAWFKERRETTWRREDDQRHEQQAFQESQVALNREVVAGLVQNTTDLGRVAEQLDETNRQLAAMAEDVAELGRIVGHPSPPAKTRTSKSDG